MKTSKKPALSSASITNKPTTNKTAAAILPTVNSDNNINSSLHLRIEGFIKAKNHAWGLGLDAAFLSLEVESRPEMQKASCPATQLNSLPRSSVEFEASVLWHVGFQYPVTYSPQQRNAAYVKFNLYQHDTSNKGNSNTHRRFLSTCSMDIASILSCPGDPFVSFLPLLSLKATADMTTPLTHDDSLLGWIAVCFQYGGAEGVQQSLSVRSQSAWDKLLAADSSLHHLLLDIPVDTSNLRPSELVFLRDAPSVPFFLHVALADLQLTPMEKRNLLADKNSSNGEVIVFTANLRLSSNIQQRITIEGVFSGGDGGTIAWTPSDAVINTRCLPGLSLTLEITLRVRSGLSDKRYGSCSCLVAVDRILSAGLPVNLSLPVKDSIGNDIKLGMLQLGMQTSAMTTGRPPTNGNGNGLSSTALVTTTGPEVNGNGNTATINSSFNYLRSHSSNQRSYLLLEYLEGNISQQEGDPHSSVAPSDLFFEAGLLLNEDILSLLPDDSQENGDYVSRSGILFGHAIDHWPLSSRLLLPPDLAIYLQRIKAADSLSLAIAVKSSALSSFPEQGRARVSVPNAVFRQSTGGGPGSGPGSGSGSGPGSGGSGPGSGSGGSGSGSGSGGRKFEQWISFHHRHSSNDGEISSNSSRFAGRVRLRVSMVTEDMSSYPPLGPSLPQAESELAAAGSSIGRVSMRLLGVHSSRNGVDEYSERVLLAQATSTLSSLDDYDDDGSDGVMDRASLSMESYNNNASDYSSGPSPLSAMGMLTGNVCIPCGSTDISIDLKTETAISAFTVCFPAARALPKLPPSHSHGSISGMMTVPELVLPMSKRRNLKQQQMVITSLVQDPDSALTINRLDSSLKLQVCFVPYLEGTLMVKVHGLKGGPFLRAGRDANSDPLSARLSMGYPAPSSFDHTYPVPPTINSTSNDSSGGVCRLKLSTLELLQQEGGDAVRINSVDDRERRGLLPLVIHLFESLPLQDTALGMVQEHSPVLVGQVFTAPIYMLALRRLISSKAKAKAGSDNCNGDSEDLLWLPVLADLFPCHGNNSTTNGRQGKQQRLQLALSLSFKVEAIPKMVASPLTSLIFNHDYTASNSEEEDSPAAMARVELGLKQAFLLADADNSGSISSSELLAAIKKAGSQKINKGKTAAMTMTATTTGNINTMAVSKGGNKGTASQANLSPPPIGLENTAQLLMTLAGPMAYPSNSTTALRSSSSGSPNRVLFEDQILEGEVKEIFRRLDIDGDGSISWLEWKSVLTISLFKQQRLRRLQLAATNGDRNDSISRQQRRVDPLDPLLVTLFAALDLVKPSHAASRYPEEINPVAHYSKDNNTSSQSMEAFRDLQKQYGLDNNLALTNRGSEDSDSSLLAVTQRDRSKVSARLQMMVQSLRTTNSLLSQRLEEALTASQQPLALLGNTNQTMIDIDMASTNNSNRLASNSHSRPFSPIADLKEQQLHHDHLDRLNQQSEQYALALSAANQRSDILSSQLAGYRSASATQQSRRDKQDIHDSEDMQHITAFIAQRLEGIEQTKIEKKRRLQAMVVIKVYIRVRALPRIRKKLRGLAKKKITKNLTAIIAAQRRLQHSQKLRKAVVCIQRVMRGCLSRRAMKKKKLAAIALQRTYRGGIARDQVKQVKAEKAAAILVKKNKAAVVIADRYREHRMWKRARAIAIIHKHAANYQRRKQAKKEVVKRKEEKRQLERLTKAARVIQIFARLWKLRRLAKAEAARRKARRDFYKDLKKLHLWPERPDIRSVNGFWIAELTSFVMQASQSAEMKLPEHIFSMIESSDPTNRVLHVKFMPKQVDPAITPSFEKKVVAFDHPQLNWYSTHPPPAYHHNISSPSGKQQEQQHHPPLHHHRHSSQQAPQQQQQQPFIIEVTEDDHEDEKKKEDDEEKKDGDDNKDQEEEEAEELHVIQSGDELIFSSPTVDPLQFFDINHNDNGLVPLPRDCTRGGYQVTFSTDGAEMQNKLGLVTAYDGLNNLIGIDFDRTSSSSSKAASRLTWLRYDHPYLSWFNREGGLLSKRKADNAHLNNNYHPGVLGAVPIVGGLAHGNYGVGAASMYHGPIKRSTPAKQH